MEVDETTDVTCHLQLSVIMSYEALKSDVPGVAFSAKTESTSEYIYNYDETNTTDDPGARKVIVPRNCERVERAQNFSRRVISIMVCGDLQQVVTFSFLWSFIRPPTFTKIGVSVGLLELSIKTAQVDGSTPISLRSGFVKFYCHTSNGKGNQERESS
ncbi:hypothetical protein NQ318_004544 [Aromia moschata]|uniref:Uncharacterized protein n=1 Tax=Aromia moschata TaxID=1265417 RepID=A0AAV8XQ02_9CUCU|nr:hypothetical protein NQ318_004544 [Aromia moschata]